MTTPTSATTGPTAQTSQGAWLEKAKLLKIYMKRFWMSITNAFPYRKIISLSVKN